jgi:hypothetical protein
MIDKQDFVSLKLIRTELQVAIWRHEKSNAPIGIIDEMKEALKHLTKAMDIFDWNGELYD